MSRSHTVVVPVQVLNHLETVLSELERVLSPYQPEFLARMYRARASDLEGKGRSLAEVRARISRLAR